ncbi:zinc finger protein 708-like [Phlebotomus papatasi]|uniref:zinc finger protein 708-like n=1 Tax=Phlebotomus papatasi TaxID=29031 RepID=UPI0024833197|nr:zinc finger protein 708-like [Phlebotomus papatasi]
MDANSNSVCRLCLRSKKHLQSIVDGAFEAVSYLDVYSECVGRTLEDFPEYPMKMCRKCENEMLIAYQFRLKCLDTEEKLKAATEQTEFVDVKEEPEDVRGESDDQDETEEKEEDVPVRRRRSKSAEGEDEKKYPCEICGNRYPSRNSLNAHRWHIHKLRPPVMPCKRCGGNFKTRQEKNGHECLRQCEHCGKNISGKHFAMHLMRHTNTKKEYKCTLCPKEYFTPADLSKHKLVSHVKSEFTLCVICGKMVKQSNLHMHAKSHQPKSEATKKTFPCEECSKVYCSAASLRIHVDTIHLGMKVLKVKCPHCQMGFKEHSHRTAHIYKYHLKKPLFSCVHCQKDFYHKSHFNNHNKVHHSFEKLYHCSICSKAFALDSRRKMHEALHSDERRFMCSTCSKSFKLRNHLIRHMRGHTGEKIFCCPHCSNLFYSIRSVRGHVKRDHPDKEMPPPGTILSKKKLDQLAKQRELEQSLLNIPVDPQLLPTSIQAKLQADPESTS